MKYLIFLLMLFPIGLQAGLDEVVLSSKDKKCAIRYLTTKPMKGWTIETKAECSDGWVHGYNRVEILDIQKKSKQTLNGFFMDGYWLGLLPAKGHILNRLTPQENVQSLTFIMDKDEEQNNTYIVQLRSTKNEDGSYTEFQGCPIFRLMVINPERKLFDNEVFQEQIAQKAFRLAQKLCAKLETIAVFGATKTDALASDVIFQMQIDAESKEKNIIPIQTDFNESDIAQPIELRHQSSEVLMAVIPEKDGFKIDYSKSFSYPEKSIPQKETLPITSLAHLDVQSRITDKPVQGKVIVHINKIDLDGSALTDLPQKVLLKHHPKLKIGWAIIQGNFYQNEMQVTDIKTCQKEWCSDVS